MRATVAWQATIVGAVGLVVGIPLGILIGRWSGSWSPTASASVRSPRARVLWLLVAIGAALVVVNLIAYIPARSGGPHPARGRAPHRLTAAAPGYGRPRLEEDGMPGDVIEPVIEKWHAHLRGELPGGLDELLDDDVVFYSPIVYTPQEGKAITKLYLEAAGQTLPGDSTAGDASGGDGSAAGFRYTKQVLAGDTAVLEFETTVEGKYVNGVDIIRCNDAGKHRRVPGDDPPAAGDQPRAPADGRDAGADAVGGLTATSDRNPGTSR